MSKRLKPFEFIRKAKLIHGEKYDYSEVEYVYADEKIPIICYEHGRFMQNPNKHLSGQGCRKCGINRRADVNRNTKYDFIEKASIVHNNKYNYDEVIYKNNHAKVKIICPEHGIFEMTPGNHTHKTNPQGCPVCGGKTNWNFERFLSEAKNIHGEKYDYSNSVWTGLQNKLKIRCKIHGEFLQTPLHHIKRKQGCPDCSGTKKSTTQKFIEKAKRIHGDKYNYEKVIYTGNHNKVIITCSKHGDFNMTPANHTHKNNPQGCFECSGRTRWTRDSFIRESNKIHDNQYDYSKVSWNGLREKVKIICPYHGSFQQKPLIHLNGSGCKKCISPKGETLVRRILKKHKIDFIEQKTFNDCRDKNLLPFDFFIQIGNKKGIIEFHGEQHYRPINYSSINSKNYANYESVKKHDNIKSKYCLKNDIQLLVIPFNENYVEEKVLSLIKGIKG